MSVCIRVKSWRFRGGLKFYALDFTVEVAEVAEVVHNKTIASKLKKLTIACGISIALTNQAAYAEWQKSDEMTGWNKINSIAVNSASQLHVAETRAVSIWDGPQNNIGTIKVPGEPQRLAFGEDDKLHAYVNDQVSARNVLSVWDQTNKLTDAEIANEGYFRRISFDNSGNNLYLAVREKDQVLVLDPTTFQTKTVIPAIEPAAIVFNKTDNKLYIAEKDSISVWSGNVKTMSIANVSSPTALACDSIGNIYITENARDVTNFTTVGKISVWDGDTKEDTGITGLQNSFSLAFDGDDNLYIAEHLFRNLVSVWKNGVKQDQNDITVSLPIDMAFDDAGRLYIASQEGDVSVWSGTVRQDPMTIAKKTSFKRDGIGSPIGLAFSEGKLYIAESQNYDLNGILRYNEGNLEQIIDVPQNDLMLFQGAISLAVDTSPLIEDQTGVQRFIGDSHDFLVYKHNISGHGIATHGGKIYFVETGEDGQISVLQDGVVQKSLAIFPSIIPQALSCDKNGYLYVAEVPESNWPLEEGKKAKISIWHNSIEVDSIALPNDIQFNSFAVDPSGLFLYIADQNNQGKISIWKYIAPIGPRLDEVQASDLDADQDAFTVLNEIKQLAMNNKEFSKIWEELLLLYNSGSSSETQHQANLEKLKQILVQISPESYFASDSMVIDQVTSFNQSVIDSIGGVNSNQARNIWATGYTSQNIISKDYDMNHGTLMGYQTALRGLAIGADKQVSSKSLLGMAAGYSTSNASNDIEFTATARNYALGIYNKFNLTESFTIATLLSYNKSHGSAQQIINSAIMRSMPKASTLSSKIELGGMFYVSRSAKAFEINPTLGLEWSNRSTEGFSETSLARQELAMRFAARRNSDLIGSVGLKFTANAIQSSKFLESFAPFVRIGFSSQLLSQKHYNYPIACSFIKDGNSHQIRAYGQRNTMSSLQFGAGFALNFSNSHTLLISANSSPSCSVTYSTKF